MVRTPLRLVVCAALAAAVFVSTPQAADAQGLTREERLDLVQQLRESRGNRDEILGRTVRFLIGLGFPPPTQFCRPRRPGQELPAFCDFVSPS